MVDFEIIELDIGEVITIDLNELLPISGDLSKEFTNQASLYAWVAVNAAKAEATWIESKRELDKVYAKADKNVRYEYSRDDRKITEPLVKAEIKLRRGYIESQMDELDCREQHLIMQALVRAFDMRSHMLSSLGAQLRAEAEQTGMQISDFKDELRKTRAKTKDERRKRTAELDAAELKDQHEVALTEEHLQKLRDQDKFLKELDEIDEDSIPF